VLLGTTYSHPDFRDGVERAVWDSPRAIVPIEFADVEFTGYRAWLAQTVIVGHVVEHDGELLTVAVDEVVAGDFARDSFLLDARADWLAPLPEPSDVQYLWSFSFDGATTDTLRDLRPATEQVLSRTREELARSDQHPVVQYRDAIPPLAGAGQSYRVASLYKGAPVVAATEVTSNACCANDSDVYAGETVIEALSGSGAPSTVTTIGRYRCGHQFVSAFDAFEASPDEVAGWGCQQPNTASNFSDPVVHRMDLSEENLASARAWIESAPPIFRLHPEDTVATPASFEGTDVPGMWSWPEPFEFAFLAGYGYQFIEIDEVVSTELGHEVTITLSKPQLDSHTAKLFFRCGDERLLQKGSRWLAPFVHGFDASIANGFLVPGVLLPVSSEFERVVIGVRYATVERVDSP
jgi:hypothetical protein